VIQKFCGEVPQHRIKTVIESSVRAAEKITSASDSEIESELEDDGGDPGFVQDFKFQQEGQMVAVYFHEDFYIGEVVWVLSEDNGEINFMEKAKQVIKGREVFRWPSRTDQCEISRGYVFAVSILLHPSSSSGRTFFVTTPENLSTMYTNFKRSLDWKCSVHIFLFIIFFQSS